MTVVIGLTGSIATGKSTIAALFKQKNIPIVDADLISREIVEKDQAAYHDIVAHFGQQILASDQTIDRKKLGTLIFTDPSKREELNKIVHPIIIDQIIDQRDHLIIEEEPIIVLDIPLLYELKLTHLVDQVVVVYASYQQQLKRLIDRDQLTEVEAERRIKSQMAIEDKRKKTDYVIDNNGSKEKAKEQFDQLFAKLTSRK